MISCSWVTPPCLVTGFANGCSKHKAPEIGRQSERWRWEFEEAIRAREHALKPGDITAAENPRRSLKYHQTSSPLRVGAWRSGANGENVMRLEGGAFDMYLRHVLRKTDALVRPMSR